MALLPLIFGDDAGLLSLFALFIIILALSHSCLLGVGMAFFPIIFGDEARLLSLFAFIIILLAISQQLFKSL